jgi:hypothetical protein
MARADLIQGLRDLGFEVTERGQQCVSFPFTIRSGRFAGRTVTVGFQAGEDWPFNPPPGPHVTPPLLPTGGGDWPLGGVHAGRLPPFMDGNWQYWSRPFPNWASTDRTVRSYVEHLHHVFDAVPATDE